MIKFGKLEGVPQLEKAMQDLIKKMPTAARRGLYTGLEFIMTDAKMNYVPVKDGYLRMSGFVLIRDEPGRVVGTIGFGGPAGSGNMGETNSIDVNYAEKQHETMEYHHEVGQAKFLERPLFAGMPMLRETIADEIRKELT